MNEKNEIAEAFDQDTDPLEKFGPTFEDLDADPFELFIEEIIETKGVTDYTLASYDTAFRDWKRFMREQGRHPACPSEDHVRSFIESELEGKGNAPNTVKEKVRKVNAAYEYWQNDGYFPHPTDYNPVKSARSKINWSSPKVTDYPQLTLGDLRQTVGSITNIRDCLIVVCQLKLGLRATELCNIKISEMNIQNREVMEHFPELGTHPAVEDRPNSVYIPHDREGNKSKRPRVIPLDDETQTAIVQYLLIRPDNSEPWLLLSRDRHDHLHQGSITETWTKSFSDYQDVDGKRPIKSHFGRHWFTTFWKIEKGLDRDLVKYMRGDTVGNRSGPPEAIDSYIHVYYEDIEPVYRDEIFRLRV